MRQGLSETEVEFLDALSPDELVEVFDKRSSIQWRGTVEEVAPELAVAWIRTEGGERKILDIREHFVRQVPWSETFYAVPLP